MLRFSPRGLQIVCAYLDQTHEGGTKITEAALKRSPEAFLTLGAMWNFILGSKCPATARVWRKLEKNK